MADKLGVLSPFAATFALPLEYRARRAPNAVDVDARRSAVFFGYVGWSILYNAALLLAMMRLFRSAVARGGLRSVSR